MKMSRSEAAVVAARASAQVRRGRVNERKATELRAADWVCYPGREALRSLIITVAQREFEDSITTEGAIAYGEYLGDRIANTLMPLLNAPSPDQQDRDSAPYRPGGES